jgi:hypothetical protein
MPEKKPRRPGIPALLFTAAAMLLLYSCAAQQNTRREFDPIIGQWKTNQNILLTVHRLTGNELVAEITSAPGFFSADLGAGSMLVRNIQPLSPVMYSGLLTMPGNEKPIAVRLRLMNTRTVVVDTADRRAQGNKMLWKKVANPTVPKQ